MTIFFAYYCAYKTSGASGKKGLSDSNSFYKFLCAITGDTDTTSAKSVFKRGEKYLYNSQFEKVLAGVA